MIGKNWTNKSAIVRLSYIAPVTVGLSLRALTLVLGTRIDPPVIFGFMIATICWLGFVAWRLAMNAHGRNAYFGDMTS